MYVGDGYSMAVQIQHSLIPVFMESGAGEVDIFTPATGNLDITTVEHRKKMETITFLATVVTLTMRLT